MLRRSSRRTAGGSFAEVPWLQPYPDLLLDQAAPPRFAAPEAYGIGIRGAIHPASLVEMAIGLTIGAITFTGSIVAFAKLQGLVSGRPLTFAGQHPINLALGILLIALIVLFVMTEASSVFALLVLLSLAFGFLLIVPIGGAHAIGRFLTRWGPPGTRVRLASLYDLHEPVCTTCMRRR